MSKTSFPKQTFQLSDSSTNQLAESGTSIHCLSGEFIDDVTLRSRDLTLPLH
jgi:hypothetical protein